MPRALIPWLDMPTDDWCSPTGLHAVEAALDGTGAALAAGGLPRDDAGSTITTVDADVAVVMGTSGSTGRRKLAQLTAEALLASVDGVAQLTGGPAQWLVCSTPVHITGLQAIIRTLVAGWEPAAVAPGHFDAQAFLHGCTRLDPTAPRHHAAMVPTQLVRLLRDPDARAALACLDTVMVGGAPLPQTVRDEAETAGIHIVTGYGASEVSGGCIYDGQPIDVLSPRIDSDGRLWLGGPICAVGYLGAPEATREAFHTDRLGTRWFRTNDVACWQGNRIRVLGRIDDMVITGGLKVSPLAVEHAIIALPEVSEAIVVGVPDEEWGQVVAAAIVVEQGHGAPNLRRALVDVLPPHCLPRRQLVLPELPTKGPGKADRHAVIQLFAREHPAS